MSKHTNQISSPLHIENTVNNLSKQELRLPEAFKTYRRMLEDEYIGGGYGLIQSLVNKLDYKIKVPNEATVEQKKLVKALNESLSGLEGIHKTQLLNYIMSMCYYGHSMFEMVFKRVKGNMVFDTLSPIHPLNVKRYTFSRNVLTKLELSPSENDGDLIVKDVLSKEISGDKVLMFTLNADLDNPLGRSILNRCYAPWRKKEIVSEYELIGVAKNLSGVLKIKAPQEYINDYFNNPTSEHAQYLEELISQAEQLHAGKTCLSVIPSDTNQNGVAQFDITTIGNSDSNDIDTNEIIKRLETSILTTLYTDILMLGQAGGGSFALSDSKTALLSLVIDSILATITRSFDKAIKSAFNLNVVDYRDDITLEFEGVEQLDFEAFTRGWQRLAQANLITPDDNLEKWIRERSNAPEFDKTTAREVNDKTDQNERLEKDK